MTSRTHQIYNIIFEHGFDPPPRLNNVKKNCTFLSCRLPLDLSCILIVSQNIISTCNQWCTRKKFWLLVIECDLPITIHPNFLFFIFPLFRDICSCFREIFCVLGECWLERIFLDTKVKLLKVPKTSKYTKIVQG